MPSKQVSFSEAMKQLQELNRWFQQEDIDLETGLQKLEQGKEMLQQCHQRLQQIEHKFQTLKLDFEALSPQDETEI